MFPNAHSAWHPIKKRFINATYLTMSQCGVHVRSADRVGPTLPSSPTFIDLFAGCGGLSLGLMQAGWTGLFAIEKDKFAFETLSANLCAPDRSISAFDWPDWLPREPTSVGAFSRKYAAQLKKLRGSVDLLVGGPPCQGFSSAGRRDPNDPRNQLMADYLRVVRLVQPKLVLVENVRGMTLDFTDSHHPVNYADKLVRSLAKDYRVQSRVLNLSAFGVPQNRSRLFIVGIAKECGLMPEDIFSELDGVRRGILRAKGLVRPVSAKSAISDLEVRRNGVVANAVMPRFDDIKYLRPLTQYQKLMRVGATGAPTDTRLARHTAEVAARFRKIIRSCQEDGRLNVSIGPSLRERFGLKKHAIRVLDPDEPAPTITSMPDDLLHYDEPRTLTVRENARLQSFPDWFEFRGKYTTGGHLRKIQVPRFTQVANAVPPLAAEIIGTLLLKYAMAVRPRSRRGAPRRGRTPTGRSIARVGAL